MHVFCNWIQLYFLRISSLLDHFRELFHPVCQGFFCCCRTMQLIKETWWKVGERANKEINFWFGSSWKGQCRIDWLFSMWYEAVHTWLSYGYLSLKGSYYNKHVFDLINESLLYNFSWKYANTLTEAYGLIKQQYQQTLMHGYFLSYILNKKSVTKNMKYRCDKWQNVGTLNVPVVQISLLCITFQCSLSGWWPVT